MLARLPDASEFQCNGHASLNLDLCAHVVYELSEPSPDGDAPLIVCWYTCDLPLMAGDVALEG
jgi:hypothetical protein